MSSKFVVQSSKFGERKSKAIHREGAKSAKECLINGINALFKPSRPLRLVCFSQVLYL